MMKKKNQDVHLGIRKTIKMNTHNKKYGKYKKSVV